VKYAKVDRAELNKYQKTKNRKKYGGKKMKWKQITAILALAILILCLVPLALADNEGKEKVDKELDPEATAAEGEATEGDNAKVASDNTLKVVAANKKAKMEKVKENVAKAKEKYNEAKEKLKEQKEKLTKLKKDAKECTGECAEAKQKARNGAAQHLAKTSDLITKSLERLLEKVDNSALTDAEKADAKAKINELEAKVTAEKEKVEALGETVTKQQLQDAVKELKGVWQEVSKMQKKVLSQLINNKLGNLVEKQGEYATSMEAKVAELKAAGKDTAKLEEIMAQFNAKVTEVNVKHEAAKKAWLESEKSEEAKEAWKKAWQEVKSELKSSHDLLKNFMAEYRAVKGVKSGEPKAAENEGESAASEAAA
jgi:chromosome segregation ATPase